MHGYRIGMTCLEKLTNDYFNVLEASPLVVLNALGFIGFKVIAVAGTIQVSSQSSIR